MTQPTPTSTSNYTADEIQAAVQSLVLSSITAPYDALGVRRSDISFGQIQQAAAGVFILYPSAPFYVLFLGAKRIQDLITTEAGLLSQLQASIQATGRKVLPIDDVSALFNTQASLQALSSAAAQRTSTLDVTKAPAYQQFATNVSAFLSGPGQNIKENGAIVQTPQEAQGLIPGLLAQVQAAHAATVSAVQGFVDGLADYNGLNLPSIVASSVLANAATVVGQDASALQSLTPTQRLAQIRAVVLNLLSVKAAVNTFGTFNGPSDFYALTGTGFPYSDAQHEAEPAVALGTIAGAVSILAGVNDVLSVLLDGSSTPVNVTLAASTIAELDGQNDDSVFVVGNGSAPATAGSAIPNNNTFKIRVGSTLYVASLTLSAPGTPAQVTGSGDTTTAGWYGGGGLLDGTTLNMVADGVIAFAVTFSAPANSTALVSQINAVSNVGRAEHGVLASLTGVNLTLTTQTAGQGSSLQLSGTSVGVLDFTVVASAGSANPRTADQVASDINSALPADVRAEAYYSPLKFIGNLNFTGINVVAAPPGTDWVALGLAPLDTLLVSAGVNVGAFFTVASVTSTNLTLTTSPAVQADAPTEAGAHNRKVKILCVNPAVQVPDEIALTLVGDTPASKACLSMLGLVDGMTSSCQRTTLDLVAKNIAGQTSTLGASTQVTNSVQDAPARTDLFNPNLVSFAEAETLGAQAFAGTTLTYTVGALTRPGATAVGHALVLRGGPNAGDSYILTSINGSTDTTPHALAPGDTLVGTGSVAGSAATSVDAEFGPILHPVKYDVVTIETTQNSGMYFVQGPGPTPIDVLLIQTLPQQVQGAAPVIMTASFGEMFLSLSSSNVTTSSQVVVQGAAAGLFYSPAPFTQLGASTWFKLPSLPNGLQAGDLLETYLADYSSPSNSYAILQVVPGLNILEIEPAMVDGTIWVFTPQPVPFARLRVGTVNDYSLVQAELETWLAAPVNQPLFFTNFNRLVNPLLVSANPTAVQVGTAASTLNSLWALLEGSQASALGEDPSLALDTILGTYTVEPVPPVDTLIASFSAKGSDRAVDLLLAGQFSTFFNLTPDQASYAGQLQTSVRAVAMNDLPVRRYNRPEAQTSQLMAQSASPDFEYTANSMSETLQGEQVNPPGTDGTTINYGTTTGTQGAGG